MNNILIEKFGTRLRKIEVVLNNTLPKTFSKELINSAFQQLPDAVEQNHLEPLSTPCRDILLRGGKRWRTLLLVLSCALAGGEEEKAYPLTPLVEFCHTASLIHDDLEDNSAERRGGPAIHIKYGTDTAINSGSWLYFHGMHIIEEYSQDTSLKASLYKCYSENLRRLHLGQAMDIAWHRSPLLIPSLDEYTAMIALKTGSLTRLSGELGFIAAGKQYSEASEYGQSLTGLGIAFQILDDVKNITSGNAGKMRGDDIVEGKKSLPVILHLKKIPSDLKYLGHCFETAKQEGINSPSVEAAINLIEKSGAIKEAEEYAYSLAAKTLKNLDIYQDNYAEKLLKELFSTILSNSI